MRRARGYRSKYADVPIDEDQIPDPDAGSRGRWFPHPVGLPKNARGVNLPLSNVTEEALLQLLDSIPHSVWPHKRCQCNDCQQASAALRRSYDRRMKL